MFFFSYAYSFPSESIYNLNLDLTDKDGNILKLSSLSGKIQVVSMIYTNCKTICPIIIANMKVIEKLAITNNLKGVRFSLVSLDPDRDSIDLLNKYFKGKRMDDVMWNIYRASKDDTLKLALTFGIKYKKERNNEYTHSNLIIILDRNGVIRMHHQGLDKNFDYVLKLISSLQ